ncbi:RodZ domain-containing protein [Arsukibacterium sp.]|uniref:RodZ domain-containing protein n=1 Tax=Arsukibacterium sp. TaxID=1977258 RepID=UPI00299DCED9|nr:RodZ domain-containing protein [Arsukibacterium sp.]MDX1676203.1 DUF4115 domain-containing protein [Arsukibacterium sp.]
MSTPEQTTTEMTAGQLLRQAREQRKLSMADVALQLNLRLSLVQQIEADQFDSSILITFVRGYLRAYARLVKLPENQVLKAFEQQHGGGTDPAKPMRTFSNRTGRQATENRFMWLTYAIGLLLVLMLVLWGWQTASPDAEGRLEQPVTQTLTGSQQLADSSTASTTGNMASDSGSTAIDAGSDRQALAEALNPAGSEPFSMSDSTVASLPDAVAMPPEPEPASPGSGANDESAQADVITMNFQDSCWIDVLDADGNRIAYGTKEPGYQMTVSGKAPFVVTLGNPGVVRITLNNQPFDMSSLPAGRVAKFTLAEPD